VRKLSGGQRRRLDFALALAGDPDLVFLDERRPASTRSPRRLWTAVENLRSLGKTIVLTTHYLDEAEYLADRVAILLDGRIKIVGSTREVAKLAELPAQISFSLPNALRDGEIPPPDGIELIMRGPTATCRTRNTAATLRRCWTGRRGTTSGSGRTGCGHAQPRRRLPAPRRANRWRPRPMSSPVRAAALPSARP